METTIPRKTLAEFLNEEVYAMKGNKVLNIYWEWVPEKDIRRDEIAYFPAKVSAIAQLKMLKTDMTDIKFKIF